MGLACAVSRQRATTQRQPTDPNLGKREPAPVDDRGAVLVPNLNHRSSVDCCEKSRSQGLADFADLAGKDAPILNRFTTLPIVAVRERKQSLLRPANSL